MLVVEVAVEGDYFQVWVVGRGDGVGGVVGRGLLGDGRGKPVVVRPEGGDVGVVPGELRA